MITERENLFLIFLGLIKARNVVAILDSFGKSFIFAIVLIENNLILNKKFTNENKTGGIKTTV
jgi:hypothetical protein